MNERDITRALRNTNHFKVFLHQNRHMDRTDIREAYSECLGCQIHVQYWWFDDGRDDDPIHNTPSWWRHLVKKLLIYNERPADLLNYITERNL